MRLIETAKGERALDVPFVRHPLTTEDVVKANLALKGESNGHRHWPKEVVAKFLAADVISFSNKIGDTFQIDRYPRSTLLPFKLLYIVRRLRKHS